MKADVYELEEQQFREQVRKLFEQCCNRLGERRAMGLFAEVTEKPCMELDTDDCIRAGFEFGYKQGFIDGCIS